MAIQLSEEPAPELPYGLLDFEGVWRFRRKIIDRKLGQISQGQGTLRLSRDGDDLRYDEEVTLDMPVWSATWDVSGPRKDYRMETLFARDRSGDAGGRGA